MTNAAIVPGTQPHIHKRKTIIIDPQPLSTTDKGGKIIASNTLQILILFFCLMIDDTHKTEKQQKCYRITVMIKFHEFRYFQINTLV